MELDSKSRKQLILVGCLAPVLVVLLWANLIDPALKRSFRRAAAPAAAAKAAPVPASAPATQPADPKEIAGYEDLEWKKNPFVGLEPVTPKGEPAPVRKGAAPTPTFFLEGVLWDDRNPYAVVNGEVRGVGDKIGQYEVVEITRDSVTLRSGDEVLELKLFPDLNIQ
jgi:hypothetical protein